LKKAPTPILAPRPLRRAIEQHVEDPLSEEILRGSFKGKDLIRITVKTEAENNKHLYFEAISTKDQAKPQLAQAASDAT